MNPVFVILVIVGAVILWLLLSFVFPFIGRLVKSLINNADKAISKEDVKTKNEKENDL